MSRRFVTDDDDDGNDDEESDGDKESLVGLLVRDTKVSVRRRPTIKLVKKSLLKFYL